MTDKDYSGLKPKFNEFLITDGDKYEVFKERVEIFFARHSVPAEKQPAIFLDSVDLEIYKFIRESIFPLKPIESSMEKIFEVLDEHFKVIVNVRAERFKLGKVQQEPGESLTDFVVRLREASSRCDYGSFIELKDKAEQARLKLLAKEDALVDHFVMGLHNADIQERLLRDDPKTFDKAFAVAKTVQMAIEERKTEEVNQIRPRTSRSTRGGETSSHHKQREHSRRAASPRPRSVSSRETDSLRSERSGDRSSISSGHSFRRGPCSRCGFDDHFNGQCPAWDKTCDNCKKRGHFARCCRQRRQVLSSVHSISINSLKDKDKLQMEIVIGGIRTTGFVDSGSCANIISPDFAKKLSNVNWYVDTNTNRLVSFSGDAIAVIGKVVSSVEFAGVTRNVEFLVVQKKKSFSPLLGRPALDILCPGWRSVFQPAEICEVKENFVAELVRRFPRVFDGNLRESIVGFKADIILKVSHVPIFAKMYNVPLRFVETVKAELRRLLQEGILEECTHSLYASPMVVVKKQDKSIRICIDCKRTINPFIENANYYPLPNIDMIFASLNKARVFCVLDLSNAYLQVELTKESQQYLTINTIMGLLRYKKLPFGVAAAPSIFQSIIDRIIEGLELVKAYLDDIIIGGKDEEECYEKLILVLDRLNKYNVKVNLKKCKFIQKKVEYLGHVLGEGKVTPNPKKTEAIVRAPVPKDVKELRSYMGMINHFRKFIPDLSSKLLPLYQLLKEDQRFVWSDECERVFQESKRYITSESCLKLYNEEAETLILCDASPVGIAAVLVQKDESGTEWPVYYASKALNDTQMRYAQLHREGLAVIFGLKKFYNYIYGRVVTIVTDAQSIKEMFAPNKATAPVAAARIQRWSVFLNQFDYQIEHRSSKQMCLPDALSRLPINTADDGTDLEDEDDFEVNKIGEILPIPFQDIKEESLKDKEYQGFVSAVRDGFPVKCDGGLLILKRLQNNLLLDEGVITYNDRVLIPRKLRSSILQFCHENHQGVVLMKKLAREHVYWPCIDQDIEEFVKKCTKCQQWSHSPKKKVTSSWEPCTRPMERIHIDFFTIWGKTCILIVDAYSKYIEVKWMRKTDANSVITVLNQFFGFFGLPEKLVSDNGPPFQSRTFIRYCESHCIKVLKSPPYHPESNGQAEVSVRIVKNTLRKMRDDDDFNSLLQRFQRTYHCSPRTTTEASPLEMILGYKPRFSLDLVRKNERKTKPQKNVTFKTPIDNRNQMNFGYKEFRINDKVYFRIADKNNGYWVPCTIVNRESKFIYKIRLRGKGYRRVHCSTLRERIDSEKYFQGTANKKNDSEERPTRKRRRSFDSFGRELPRRSKRLKRR